MSIISEQVKELRELADGYKMADRPLAANTIYQAADTIESLSAKLAANSGWIPCSERLRKLLKTEKKSIFSVKHRKCSA